MSPKAWRLSRNLTAAECGRQLAVGGVNPSAAWTRIETGSARIDADLAVRIEEMTGGAVTPHDLHELRLAWLTAHGRGEDAEAAA